MTFKNHRELFQALLDGKKIRDKDWGVGAYIYLDDSGKIMWHDNQEWIFDFRDFCKEELKSIEIYQEPKPLKKIKTQRWIHMGTGNIENWREGDHPRGSHFASLWRRINEPPQEIEYKE